MNGPTPRHPHAQAAGDVAIALGADPVRGLASTEAAQRLSAHGPNELTGEDTPGWFQRTAAQFADPLVILLLAAIAISLLAWWLDDEGGLPFDAIAIGAIVALNAAIGAIQEERAERAVAALAAMAAAQAGVIRDGRLHQIPAREVVVGDTIVLTEGDSVPADARLVEANTLRISEASLTGESESVIKAIQPVSTDAALADRLSMVFAGTAAVSGRGRAVVTATAMATEVGHIATLLGETERLPTPLEREIARVGRVLGLAVVVIAFVVMGATLIASDIESATDLVDVLLIGVSLAVAAVPEGLPAVLSIVLAIGVQRMATRNALVKRLASAETLGSASVICTDKTGTLTRSEMSVRSIVTAAGTMDVKGRGYEPTGELLVDGRPPGDHPRLAVQAMLRAGTLASDATITEEDGRWTAVGDPTEAAIITAAARAGVTAPELEAERLDEVPFTSDRKRMSVVVRGTDDDSALEHLVKGAPDVILELCEAEQTSDGPVALTNERRVWWQTQIDALADQAMRTLAIAVGPGGAESIAEADETGLAILGVVGIIDPPRREAGPAVAATHEAGIRVVMITGDHPRTAAQIGTELGIVAAGSPVITGPELEKMTDDDLLDVVTDTSIFARVAPAHKLRLVAALQRQGHVVAMTGDGVNDAPALKAADIGTAMGVAGTDVAREAADMVLTDDNFATITAAVAEGRAIFHNIRSFLRYLLSSNIGEVFTMFFGVLLAGVLGLDGSAAIIAPLTATQILWINLLTDTGPALALGVDPGEEELMMRPPRRPGDRVIDATMQRGIVLVGATMAVATLAMLDAKLPGGLIDGSSDLDTARTAAFTVLVLAQLFNCFNARSDIVSAFRHWAANRWLLVAIAGSLGLQFLVVYLPALQDAFSTAPLSLGDWLAATALASSVLWVSEIRKAVRRHGATQLGKPEPAQSSTA